MDDGTQSGDVYGKINEWRTSVEKFMDKIPGLNGYIERDNRRSADKLVRDAIAFRAEELVGRVSEVQTVLVSEGQYEYLDDVERAVTKLRIFVDSVRTASYGYSGFFDKVKINEAELEQIYQYDMSMMDGLDAIVAAVDNLNLSVGTDGLPAAIRNLTSRAQGLVDAFNNRQHLLTGL